MNIFKFVIFFWLCLHMKSICKHWLSQYFLCYPSAPCRLSSSVVRDWTVLIRVCLKFQNHYFILFEPWIPSSKVCKALKSLMCSFWKQWYFEIFIQIFSKWSTYVKKCSGYMQRMSNQFVSSCMLQSDNLIQNRALLCMLYSFEGI